VCVLLLQDLLQSCSESRGGRRVEDMCYDILCGDVTCEYVCFITAGVTVCVYVSDSLSKIDRVCVFMCVTGTVCLLLQDRVCVYYCRTYYKAVRGGGGGDWRTCAMRDDEPRPVWISPLITH